MAAKNPPHPKRSAASRKASPVEAASNRPAQLSDLLVCAWKLVDDLRSLADPYGMSELGLEIDHVRWGLDPNAFFDKLRMIQSELRNASVRFRAYGETSQLIVDELASADATIQQSLAKQSLPPDLNALCDRLQLVLFAHQPDRHKHLLECWRTAVAENAGFSSDMQSFLSLLSSVRVNEFTRDLGISITWLLSHAPHPNRLRDLLIVGGHEGWVDIGNPYLDQSQLSPDGADDQSRQPTPDRAEILVQWKKADDVDSICKPHPVSILATRVKLSSDGQVHLSNLSVSGSEPSTEVSLANIGKRTVFNSKTEGEAKAKARRKLALESYGQHEDASAGLQMVLYSVGVVGIPAAELKQHFDDADKIVGELWHNGLLRCGSVHPDGGGQIVWSTGAIADTCDASRLELPNAWLKLSREGFRRSFGLEGVSPCCETFDGWLRLFEQPREAFLYGMWKPLTLERFKVIRALCESGKRLKKRELHNRAGGDAVNTLKAMRKQDPDWNAVTVLSGKERLGYGLVPNNAALPD